MKLPTCKSCHLPVIELRGQFQKLDPFYVTAGSPPPETAGWWHTKCLVQSAVGAQWCAARERNLREVRVYVSVWKAPPWALLKHPRHGDVLALSSSGEVIALTLLPPSRETSSGRIHPVIEKEFNLELEDAGFVREAQERLAA